MHVLAVALALTGSVYGGWTSHAAVPASATVTLQTTCDHSAAWVGVSGPQGAGGDWLQAGVAYEGGTAKVYAEAGRAGVYRRVYAGDGDGTHTVSVTKRGGRWVARADGRDLLTIRSSLLAATNIVGETGDDCRDFAATFTTRSPLAYRSAAGLTVRGDTVTAPM